MFDIPSIKEDSKNSDIFFNFFDSLQEHQDLDCDEEEINCLLKENNLTKKRKREEDIIKKTEKLKKKRRKCEKSKIKEKNIIRLFN